MNMNDDKGISSATAIIAILGVCLIIIAGTIVMSTSAYHPAYPEDDEDFDVDETVGYISVTMSCSAFQGSEASSTSPTVSYLLGIKDVAVTEGNPSVGLQWFLPDMTVYVDELSAKLTITYPDGATATDTMDVKLTAYGAEWTGTFQPFLYIEDGDYNAEVELFDGTVLLVSDSLDFEIENGAIV